jgi:hypothetical protein
MENFYYWGTVFFKIGSILLFIKLINLVLLQLVAGYTNFIYGAKYGKSLWYEEYLSERGIKENRNLDMSGYDAGDEFPKP